MPEPTGLGSVSSFQAQEQMHSTSALLTLWFLKTALTRRPCPKSKCRPREFLNDTSTELGLEPTYFK